MTFSHAVDLEELMGIKRTSMVLTKVSLGATGLLGVLVACGDTSSSQSGVSVADVTSKANVALVAYDAHGKLVTSCSGTLIGPTTVLTAGHCVASAVKWSVNAPAVNSGTVTGYRGVTYDWMNFQSNKSHNLHVDVGVVILEKPIALDHYPTLSSSAYDGATTVQRMRRVDTTALNASFEAVQGDVALGTSKGFAFDYLGAIGADEKIDTGGALIDPQTNVIYGVVSGRGDQTGLMHIARVDVMGKWLSTKLACHNNHPVSFTTACHPGSSSSGGSSGSSGGKDGGASCGNDGGGPTTSSSGGSSGSSGGSSGSSGGSSGGSGGGSSSGSSGGSSGGSGGGGDCEGGGSGNGGSVPPSGSSSGGSSSGFGTSGGGGSSSGFGGGNGNGGSVPPNGSSGSSGNGTLNGGGNGTGGLVPPAGGGNGVCFGSCPQNVINNVPPDSSGSGGVMPPSGGGNAQNAPGVGDGVGCNGPTCGGCFVGCGDDTIDYGGYGGQPGSGGYTQPPVK